MFSTETKSNLEIDHVEQAKFNVTRNLFTFLTLLLSALFILNWTQDDINMYPIGIGASACIVVLIILLKTKNYKFAAIVATILALFINQSNLLIASNFNNFIDFFWISNFALYVFFTLGKVIGIINLFANVIGVVCIFSMTKFGYIELIPKEYTSFSFASFLINSTFASFVFCYIILQMMKQMRLASEKYLATNTALEFRNQEKTVMLKEIHHRVKNNLQVITSLLRLQSHEVEDLKSKHHFEDSVNRVSAMAMIHEKMYQTESLSQLNLKEYLEELADSLISSYAQDEIVTCSVKSNIQDISTQNLVPIALIFNELVSNSIEHAFVSKKEGQIKIDAIQNGDGSVIIDYRDNGEWIEPSKKTSFGLELIETFTEQLDGTVERFSDKGTHYRFSFP